jgi:GH24 family phage-related lysozyme (muramidase)
MKPSHKAYELAMKYEGFLEKPELDLAPEGEKRIYRNGYGTVAQSHDEVVNWHMATLRLYIELSEAWIRLEHNIEKHIRAKLTQGMVDALSDFAFNVGHSPAKIPTLLNALNSGDMQAAADALLLYNKVTKNGIKQESEHQTKRRQEERKLFLSKG